LPHVLNAEAFNSERVITLVHDRITNRIDDALLKEKSKALEWGGATNGRK